MGKKLTQDQIADQLDITEPFLMIDEFEVVDPGVSARAIKRLTSEDWFFKCHLPSVQVMPATLQVEGMLQTMVLLIYSTEDHGEHRSYVTDINIKLVSAAKPGQDITFEAHLSSFRRGIAKGEVVGLSDGQAICRGAFRYASPHLMAKPR